MDLLKGFALLLLLNLPAGRQPMGVAADGRLAPLAFRLI
jgi:hypothetical protein